MSKWLEAAVMTRPPQLLHALLPGCEWSGPPTAAGRPVLYLTFDDGPIPEETPWVLEQLALFNARATFFCVGENLARYPELARAALAAGHRLGNHTHLHRSAWASPRAEYLAGVARCQQVLEELEALSCKPQATSSKLRTAGLIPQAALESQQPATCNLQPATNNQASAALFRPPYGRLTWPLLRALKPDYRLIMWSVLTRDYDPDLGPEACLQMTLAAVRPGDVLVFHDSRKASARLRYVLPRVLAHFAGLGYEFAAL